MTTSKEKSNADAHLWPKDRQSGGVAILTTARSSNQPRRDCSFFETGCWPQDLVQLAPSSFRPSNMMFSRASIRTNRYSVRFSRSISAVNASGTLPSPLLALYRLKARFAEVQSEREYLPRKRLRLPRATGIERLRDPPTEWSRQFEALGLNSE